MASPELNSLRNPRVSKARRLATRAFREADAKFLAEGPQAVREAIASGGVEEIFITAEAMSRHTTIVESARANGVDVLLASGAVVTALCATVTPQGMVAVVRHLDQPLSGIAPDARLIVVLSHARDPGNVGTIIRAADAVGADAIVLTNESVDPYNAKCVRASAGSLFHLPIVRGVSIESTIQELRTRGLRILAADGTGAQDLFDLSNSGRLTVPTAWLFGNEAWGLPAEVRDLADEVVRVPIYGQAESLNLASAASVCLYASVQAQRG